MEETAATATEESAESSGTTGAPAELEAAPGQEGPEGHDPHAHPSPLKYVGIAMVLAFVTAIEVGLYYLDLPDKLLVAMLLGLAFIKFAMVAAYFMHLKFDGRLLRRLFITGIVLAMAVYTVALLTLDVLLG
ncbi:MAG: cytochrome C oxidase subunit IV family protein [Acidimicrobiia bacterium]